MISGLPSQLNVQRTLPTALRPSAAAPADVHTDTVSRSLPDAPEYKMTPGGHAPCAAGSVLEQARSLAQTNVLTAAATCLNAAHGLLGMFFPPDKVADKLVQGLPLQPSEDDEHTTRPTYQSHIANASPDQVYQEFVGHTREAFAAGGTKLRLGDGSIKDQGRYMIEAPAQGLAPAVWLPVKVQLDSDKKEVDFQCLEGHPFRGDNQFDFKSDGHGGTYVEQHSRFELSSAPLSLIKGPMHIVEKQHKMWENVHGFLASHFLGNDPR